MADLTAPKIDIKRYSVSLDPPIDVFNVVLEREGGVWHESFGAESELRAFLCGVRAGCGILGIHVLDPEIPRVVDSEFKEAPYEPDNLPF